MTLPVSEPSTTVGQAVRDGEERDDQLRGVAEGGVDEAADTGAGVVRGVLGRLADEPRERDQRGGGDDEQHDVADAESVENEDDRREDEAAPENRAHGCRSLPPAAR